jgi:DNA transposition AAA+ family ATPase
MGMKEIKWELLPTIQTQEILAEMKEAKEEAMAKMIIASTGLGKTNAISAFQQKSKQNVFVITVGYSYNVMALLNNIAESIGAKKYIGHRKAQQVSAIAERLNELDKPMLVLDEMENSKVALLKHLKELYDGVNKHCSIVLFGTEQLLHQLEKRSTGQSIPQLRRRFKAGTRIIEPLRKSRDFKPFFDKYIPGNKEVQDLIIQYADNYGELHDYLYNALIAAAKRNKPFTTDFFINYHKIK